MRRTLFAAVLVLSSVSSALGETQSEKRSIEETIRRLDHERIQAQIAADSVALDRLYADDFIGVGPSGTVRSKAQVISDFTSGELKFQSITTDQVLMRVYGNTVVETGLSTMIGQDKGNAVPRDNRFTRVWVKEQGSWRLVANHYSLLKRSEVGDNKTSSSKGINFVLGTWQGTSTCVGNRPACKNETVVYRFMPIEGHPGQVRQLADKILNGERVPMGSLVFDVNEADRTLRNEFKIRQTHGVWSLTLVTPDSMAGTLVLLPEKSIGRDVRVRRVSDSSVPKAPSLNDYEN